MAVHRLARLLELTPRVAPFHDAIGSLRIGLRTFYLIVSFELLHRKAGMKIFALLTLTVMEGAYGFLWQKDKQLKVDGWTGANWIGRLVSANPEMTLGQIPVLPGSINSACPESSLSWAARKASEKLLGRDHQVVTITEQLNHGVRVLDLRLHLKEENKMFPKVQTADARTIYISNIALTSTTLDDVCKEIKTFLGTEEGESEFVVVILREDVESIEEGYLHFGAEDLKKALAPCSSLLVKEAPNAGTPLENLRGKIIVVTDHQVSFDGRQVANLALFKAFGARVTDQEKIELEQGAELEYKIQLPKLNEASSDRSTEGENTLTGNRVLLNGIWRLKSSDKGFKQKEEKFHVMQFGGLSSKSKPGLIVMKSFLTTEDLKDMIDFNFRRLDAKNKKVDERDDEVIATNDIKVDESSARNSGQP